jgi:hypothetical protein
LTHFGTKGIFPLRIEERYKKQTKIELNILAEAEIRMNEEDCVCRTWCGPSCSS